MGSTEERVKAAAKFLLQSPPGEINDVLNDVRDIIADDEVLQVGIKGTLQEYNLEQFITADVPGCEHLVIISESSRIPSPETDEEDQDRFLDPRSKKTFKFDHLRLEASDVQPYEVEQDADVEAYRAALDTATINYLTAHYHDGVTSVFITPTPNSPQRFTIQIVANKYNPSNYWSGRWRSEYLIDLAENRIDGRILVNVHYYEQGNVQLSTTHSLSIPVPPTASFSSPPAQAASKILGLIELEEGRYQDSLNYAYQDMSEKTFKSLRRALPLTRQKLDWDKVLGYKLGAELTASKGVFSAAS